MHLFLDVSIYAFSLFTYYLLTHYFSLARVNIFGMVSVMGLKCRSARAFQGQITVRLLKQNTSF